MGFFIKKLISAFLLPPGCIILLLGVCAAIQLKRRHPATAFAFLLPVLLLWALSSAFVADPLMIALERGLTIPANPNGDVIVLLGGGVYDGVPDLSGRGAPSDGMIGRVVTAVRLQHRLGLPVLFTGGSVFAGRTSEASVVKRFMVDLGVPADKILLEDKSLDTMENARFSREILKQKGLNRPILVTSAFHMRRSIEAFRKTGMEVVPVPSSFHTGPVRSTVWADWFPDAGSLETTATVVHEYLGLVFYTLSGKGKV